MNESILTFGEAWLDSDEVDWSSAPQNPSPSGLYEYVISPDPISESLFDEGEGD
jgi:hypothetical protein